MIHPLFKNLKSIAFYAGIWILLAGIQFIVLFVQYRFPVGVSLVDSLIFNLLFGILGIPLWYVVRFNEPQKKSGFNIFYNHLSSLTLVSVIWLGISWFILQGIYREEQVYTGFLMTSLPFRLIAGILLYTLLSLVYYLIIYNLNLKEKLQQEARLNLLLRETELNMLKSQINPHFLFNSLNSISSLTISNPASAREMVTKLADFLRYSVSTNIDSLMPVEKELENIKCYLDIEQVRFGEKLDYRFDVTETCFQKKIPVMLLQPIFENAIKHGVYESTEKVTIYAACKANEEGMEIVIENDFDPGGIPRKGAGLGLKNIRERLRLTYHRDDLLRIEKGDRRFRVVIRIPDN